MCKQLGNLPMLSHLVFDIFIVFVMQSLVLQVDKHVTNHYNILSRGYFKNILIEFVLI